MNIFALDYNPHAAARAHCDVHVSKMVTETAQIISTVAVQSGYKWAAMLMKPTHRHHPCTRWARHNRANLSWLCSLLDELISEHDYRFDLVKPDGTVVHVGALGVLRHRQDICDLLPDGELTSFALAMPQEFHELDHVIAYRRYYNEHKRLIMPRFCYTRCEPPAWLSPLADAE